MGGGPGARAQESTPLPPPERAATPTGQGKRGRGRPRVVAAEKRKTRSGAFYREQRAKRATTPAQKAKVSKEIKKHQAALKAWSGTKRQKSLKKAAEASDTATARVEHPAAWRSET